MPRKSQKGTRSPFSARGSHFMAFNTIPVQLLHVPEFFKGGQ